MSGGRPAVGIDLGTTHSAIAAATADGRARILPDAHGARVHPSAVSFHPSGGVLVGADARARRLIDPENTILAAKRLIGQRYGSTEVADVARLSPLALQPGENEQIAIRTRAGAITVPEVSAMVLDHLRVLAERNLGGAVDRAVVAVPANFHDGQRVATATAAEIAGIHVPFLLNEPTAAAIAYGARRELERVIAVYDFGGGTFDVSILELRGRVYEVLASAGDPFLGGEDVDARIAEAMADDFLARERIDLRQDPAALSRLREAAEGIKRELSWRHRASCRLDAIAYGRGGQPLQLVYQLDRDELVRHCGDLVERTFVVCDEALRRAGLPAAAIGDVVLVGGSTKIPHVRQRVAQYFGRAARTDVDPDGAVAVGAALQAAALEGRGPLIDEGATTLERRAQSEPTDADWRDTAEQTEVSEAGESTFDGQATAEHTERRPSPPQSEPAALAPAAPEDPPQAAGIVTFHHLPPPAPPLVAPPAPRGEDAEDAAAPLVPPSRVLDVTSHSLGLVTVAGYCEAIIARNTRVPATHTRSFTTAHEHQQSVRIQICQGESRLAAENVFLGHLELSGLIPRPRSEASIQVTFSIDESGLLRVVARDQEGRAQQVELSLVGAPSPAGVRRARERLSSLQPERWAPR